MSDTVKKKAVHVVRLTKKAAKGDQKPVFEDIQPGKVFDCPKSLVKELTDAGAITAPGKVTSSEATAADPAPTEDDDQDDGDGGTTEDDDQDDGDGGTTEDDDQDDGDGGTTEDNAEGDKDALIQKAKELGVKGVSKKWSVDTLKAKIAEAEAEDENVL